ncbi:DUF3137 domain-containing protein [Akkermansiaceae bacterium]|nr:DUF3137 domain-containing protein [Akkermansiaceae bacterium]
MKTLHDIRQKIQPVLMQIENSRLEKLKATSKAKRLYAIPLVLVLTAPLAGLKIYFPLLALLPCLAFFIFMYIALAEVGPHKENYIRTFKERVFTTFVRSLCSNVEYVPDKYISGEKFSESQLFRGHNSVSGSDYFEGKTENGSAFKFSELEAEKITSDSDGRTIRKTIFEGVFFELSVPNRMISRVQVLPDKAESSLGGLGRLMQKSLGAFSQKAKMVYMKEHPEFEKEFVVYSKDAEEAYRVLTPAMIEAIYDLRYKWNKKLRVSFIGDKTYIALCSEHDYFHPDIHKSVLDDDLLGKFYDELALCLSVVEDMSIEHEGISP